MNRLAFVLCAVAASACSRAEVALDPTGEMALLASKAANAPHMPEYLEISVSDARVGAMGVAAPGLPLWGTISPAKNLAICVTQVDHTTTCYPDQPLAASRCPSTERCFYTVRTGGGSAVVSVFNLHPIGRELIDNGLEEIRRAAGDSKLLRLATDANARRAFWRASFLLDDGSLSRSELDELEAAARDAAAKLAFPNSVDADKGALSGPFAFCALDERGAFACETLRETSLGAIEVEPPSAASSAQVRSR
jgi:hypothetical protein